ncbi:hypothetical protein [Deinococcus sp. JMULE3]|uniref:hypothetical protein n=1 Tax=Deinococcus sp. JMULE3 TaxID=2518341 RepID=UPI001576AFBC|nr:hypothetical protein [Deinococcus sp. JMULE3]NTY02038.1 hypothetical protein [Deinococcus sp. JMULE3]
MKKTIAMTVVLSTFLASCGQQRADHPTPPTGKTRVLSVQAASVMTHQDDGTLSFGQIQPGTVEAQAATPGTVEDPGQLQAGDIVVSAPSPNAPYGVLGTVSSVQSDATGTVKVSTTPTTLEEALTNANVAPGEYSLQSSPTDEPAVVLYDPTTIDLRNGDAQTAVDLNTLSVKAKYESDDLTPRKSVADPIDQLSMGSIRPLATYRVFEKQMCFNKTIIDAAGVRATADGCANINADATLNINWSWGSIKSFEARLDGALTATGNLKASGRWSAQKDIVLTSILLPTRTFWIGWVPVVVTPKYDVILRVDGTIDAQVTVSSTGTVNGSLGAKYVRGNGWTYQNALSGSAPSPTTSWAASVIANASLNSTASLYFYGAVGFGATGKAYTNLNYNASAAPGSRGSLVAGLQASVEVNARRLMPNLYYSRDLFQLELYRKTF